MNTDKLLHLAIYNKSQTFCITFNLADKNREVKSAEYSKKLLFLWQEM